MSPRRNNCNADPSIRPDASGGLRPARHPQFNCIAKSFDLVNRSMHLPSNHFEKKNKLIIFIVIDRNGWDLILAFDYLSGNVYHQNDLIKQQKLLKHGLPSPPTRSLSIELMGVINRSLVDFGGSHPSTDFGYNRRTLSDSITPSKLNLMNA